MLFRIKVSLITGVSKQLYPLVLSRSDFNQEVDYGIVEGGAFV